MVKRRGVEPGSYGGLDVVARSIDLIAGGRSVESYLEQVVITQGGAVRLLVYRLSVFGSRNQAKDHGLRTVQRTAYPT